MQRKRKVSSSPSPARRLRRTQRPASRLEFRAPADGAWYGVRLARQDGALRVMYEEFTEETDEWYEPSQFADAAQVEEFRARFRAPSPQLDDSQCRSVGPGAAVCVSCALEGGELKFYDAVIDLVSSTHESVDGEEICKCKFLVLWKDGPLAGKRSEVSIEQICCIQFSPVEDPMFIEFLDSARKLLENKGNATSHSINATTLAHEIKTYSHQEGSCSTDSICPSNLVIT